MEEKQKSYLLPASILVAAVLVSGALIYNTGSKDSAPTANVGDVVEPSNAEVNVDDDVVLGDPKAPVTLVEFGDYQCPFCKRMFDQTEKQLREEYIETGKVKMVYRDFPLDSIHPYARSAAEAAECARDQEQYWTYHDALFDRQSEIPTLDFAVLAGELGLNTGKFKECYDSKKYAKEVEKDYQDGLKAGVSGTPATFVNGKLISGAQPYSVFKAAIEAELSK